MSYDLEMMGQAGMASVTSPCNTKVGAVVTDKHGKMVGAGCNDVPKGVIRQFGNVRLEKHYVEHAERNAIAQAWQLGSPEGGTIYCTLLPCADCARAIIAAGIKRVVMYENCTFITAEYTEKYGFHATRNMFNEAAVTVDYLPRPVTLRGDGDTVRMPYPNIPLGEPKKDFDKTFRLSSAIKPATLVVGERLAAEWGASMAATGENFDDDHDGVSGG